MHFPFYRLIKIKFARNLDNLCFINSTSYRRKLHINHNLCLMNKTEEIIENEEKKCTPKKIKYLFPGYDSNLIYKITYSKSKQYWN